MQTFLPLDIDTKDLYNSFYKSVDCLDLARLRKQILETYQILRALKEPQTEKHHRLHYAENRRLKAQKLKAARAKGRRPIVRGYVNHSATRLWRGYEQLLIAYGYACCHNYKDRTGTVHMYFDFFSAALPAYKYAPLIFPEWMSNPALYASHRSNLLRKDFNYYSKFGWSESSDLEYVWPV